MTSKKYIGFPLKPPLQWNKSWCVEKLCYGLWNIKNINIVIEKKNLYKYCKC